MAGKKYRLSSPLSVEITRYVFERGTFRIGQARASKLPADAPHGVSASRFGVVGDGLPDIDASTGVASASVVGYWELHDRFGWQVKVSAVVGAAEKVWTTLQAAGVTDTAIKAIVEEWGDGALKKLENDPYDLMDLPRWGFKRADGVARKLGVALDDPRRCAAGAAFLLQSAERDGHCWSAEGLITDTSFTMKKARETVGISVELLKAGLQSLLDNGKAIVEDGRIYLKATHAAETVVAEILGHMMVRGCEPTELPESASDLHEHQADAVSAAAVNAISVLTGGPGTGKTYTINQILDMFEAADLNTACLAPTGKAAIRMSELTGRPASTIHRFVGAITNAKSEKAPPDAIIVDEMSMVDIGLLAWLLRSVNGYTTRIVFVGDVDQLPSIGPGRVLYDLLQAAPIPHTRLTHIFRQAEDSAIPYIARDINTGRPPEIAGPESNADVRFVEVESSALVAETISSLVTDELPRLGVSFGVTQVLAPQRSRNCGTNALNTLLQSKLNPGTDGVFVGGGDGAKARKGDRVIHTVNDYDKGVMNGEIGVVVDADFRGIPGEDEGVILVVDYGSGRERTLYKKGAATDVQLAYCVTVHKMQGSSAEVIIVPVHSCHSFMLTRQLVYTALTRAEKMAIFVGEREALNKSVGNVRGSVRRTTLTQRIAQEISDIEDGVEINRREQEVS